MASNDGTAFGRPTGVAAVFEVTIPAELVEVHGAEVAILSYIRRGLRSVLDDRGVDWSKATTIRVERREDGSVYVSSESIA